MIKKLLIVSILLSLWTTLSHARHDTGAEFLTFGIGARASGMGEAFVAVADDVTTTYWNPAGLGFMRKKELSVMHNSLYKDITDDIFHDFISYSYPLEMDRTIAGSLIFFHSGTHPITKYNDSLQQIETIGKFHTYDLATVLSYAQLMTENLSFGANLKYIYSKFHNIKGKGYACDLGILYKGPVQGLILGAKLENLGTKLSYIDRHQADSLPLNLKIGTSYNWCYDKNNRFVCALDINKPFYDNFIGSNIGLEWYLDERFIGRLGHYDKGGGLKGITYGAGIKINQWQFDFANVPSGDLGRDNRVSVRKLF